MAAVAKRDDLLAAVERSPQAFVAHDRTAWVGVFTSDARVEDPVGASPMSGMTRFTGSMTPLSDRATSRFIVIWISSTAVWSCVIWNSRW